MQLITHADADTFLTAARTELESAEAFNGLILGIATRLTRLRRNGEADTHGETEFPPQLFTVEREGVLRLAALRTPPRRVIVHGAPNWGEAVPPLVDHLAAVAPDLPGVVGPQPVAAALAESWRARCGGAVEAGMAMGVYELRRVLDDGDAPGVLRVAAPGDAERVTDWVCAFNEAVDEPMPEGRQGVHREVGQLIDAGQVYLWEDDGRPMSLARWGRPTAHGVCITSVYTPPACRRRGYATRCVAALSRHLLGEGFAFCTLFTDLANPTSNHIYQQIGYRRLGEFAEFDFVPQPESAT